MQELVLIAFWHFALIQSTLCRSKHGNHPYVGGMVQGRGEHSSPGGQIVPRPPPELREKDKNCQNAADASVTKGSFGKVKEPAIPKF